MIERLCSGGLPRFVRYLGTGGLLVVLDYLVFSLLLLLGLLPGPSQMLARACGALAGFLLQKTLVFRDGTRSVQGIARQGTAYIGLSVLNIVLSGLLVGFLSSATSLAPLLAKLISDGILVVETYCILHFIFKAARPT